MSDIALTNHPYQQTSLDGLFPWQHGSTCLTVGSQSVMYTGEAAGFNRQLPTIITSGQTAKYTHAMWLYLEKF